MTAAADSTRPCRRTSRETCCTGYLELHSEAPQALESAVVTLEIATSEVARAIDAAPARFQTRRAQRRLAASRRDRCRSCC